LFLQRELAWRCARNPQYSLRAFANYLGTDHATLSQLLRGKRRLTTRALSKLGTRLGLDQPAIAAYVVYEEQATHLSANPVQLAEVQQLARDAAGLISDWSHLGILELTHLPEFRPDTRWIARVLGITPDEVNLAVTRLVRLGFLEMAARDRWIDRSGDAASGLAEFAEATIQKLAEQVRSLVLTSLQKEKQHGTAGDAMANRGPRPRPGR
jgi:uncharacterized protein (TIGR02147 family)